MPNEYGITAKEATEALTAAMRLLPPPGKEDIELIKRNPMVAKVEIDTPN